MAARLTAEQNAFIVKELTLGAIYAEIQERFEKRFKRSVGDITLTRIKQKNQAVIANSRDAIAADGAASARKIKQKSYELLEGRLDDALADADRIRELRQQLRDGEINEVQYKNKVALHEQLTITELTKVSEAMNSQSKGEKDDPITPQDQAALAALLAGIQAGNPVQLIQVLTQPPTPV